jgi:carboxymethylenebutenolidase
MASPKDAAADDDPSRRQVIAAAVGGGFALAVRPVSAETINTGAEGLDTADIQIPSASGAVPAYRAMPAGGKGTKHPVILVVHEIFGVHEHIRDVCRRLANQGYLAIAPDLYARQGDVTRLTDVNEIRAVVSKVPDAQVLGDLDAAVAWAKGSGHADVSRLGITGFCWGGRIVWLYAAHSSAARAGVAWYGRLVGDPDPLHPRSPVDVAASLHAPVLGLYGGEDQSIPAPTIETMREALREATREAMRKTPGAGGEPSRKSHIEVYPHAGHAFFADYRPSYRKDAAEDGWRRALAWMKANGVG